MSEGTQNQNQNPNPKLLSLLDQIVNPLEKVEVSLKVEGVFSFPEEWKQTDDNNPNMFTYQVKMLGLEVTDGKINARELTEKELRLQEEAANAKNKKATKKDAKQDAQQLAEEEEELRKRIEKEEEEERVRLEKWNQLDEQTQFYMSQEDKHKSASLKFDMKGGHNDQEGGNIVRCVKEGMELVVFEERVNDDKGDWVYLIKQTTLSEDEIGKLKKAKPKNLNLVDLNTLVLRAWVSFEELGVPGTKSITKRCKLEQYIEDPAAEVPKPVLNNTYILLTLSTTPAMVPLITEIQPTIKDLIPSPPPIPKLSASKECVKEFKADLQLAMESLALEYSSMFAKEMGQNNDSKQKTIITVQKKQEIQKRKEHFLYDFNMSGKYKVLKERLKKSIVKICRDKFQKQGSITGITTDQKDQFYSELYVFLMEQTRTTLQELIEQKKEELHEDIVTSYEQTKKEREKILTNITKETDEDRTLRLAQEYDILNYKEMADKNYKNLINLDERNPKSHIKYAKYLLQSKDFPKAEQSLEKALSFDPSNLDYQLLISCLLMRRGRSREASVFLKELTTQDPTNLLYYSIFQFLYANYLKQDKMAEKYKKICERIYQRKNGLVQGKAQHKESPNPFELPSFKPKAHDQAELFKPPQIDKNQWDEINIEMIEYFAKNNLFELVDKSYSLLNDQGSYKAQILKCKSEQYHQNYNRALELLDELYEKINQDKTKKREIEEIISIKSNICFLSGKLYESEEIFLKAMKIKGNKKQDLSIYLRLGNIYLKRQSWGDAKAIFVKACEFKSNSSLSWLGLGISCLRLGEFKDSEEALTQSNIYDPFNGDAWGYLALLCLKDNGRFSQANQCLRELFKTDINDYPLLEEIGDQLFQLGQFDTAQTIYMKIIDHCNKQKQTPDNYGELNLKLGKVYNNLKKFKEANVCIEESLLHLEGLNERNEALALKKNLNNNLDNSFDQD